MTTIISASDLGGYLAIPDSEDSVLLAQSAAAASQWTVDYCGREFVPTAILSASARVFTPALVGNFSEPTSVAVDDFWETTALVVKVDDNNDGVYETTLTLNTNYRLEPVNGRRYGHPWPYTDIRTINRTLPCWSDRPPIQVTAAWGWTAIPAPVTLATLEKGAALFHRRQSPSGVLGGFADFGTTRVSMFEDPDIQSLLKPYRKHNPELLVG